MPQRIGEMWAQASRWPRPDDHAGYRKAIAQRMVSDEPATIRERVRGWLHELLDAEGVGMALDEPADWASWGEEHRR